MMRNDTPTADHDNRNPDPVSVMLNYLKAQMPFVFGGVTIRSMDDVDTESFEEWRRYCEEPIEG